MKQKMKSQKSEIKENTGPFNSLGVTSSMNSLEILRKINSIRPEYIISLGNGVEVLIDKVEVDISLNWDYSTVHFWIIQDNPLCIYKTYLNGALNENNRSLGINISQFFPVKSIYPNNITMALQIIEVIFPKNKVEDFSNKLRKLWKKDTL